MVSSKTLFLSCLNVPVHASTFSSSFSPVQQTTSGIGHRVKYCSFFRVGNQCAECEKQQLVELTCWSKITPINTGTIQQRLLLLPMCRPICGGQLLILLILLILTVNFHHELKRVLPWLHRFPVNPMRQAKSLCGVTQGFAKRYSVLCYAT